MKAWGDRKRQRTAALQDAGATWRESLAGGEVHASKREIPFRGILSMNPTESARFRGVQQSASPLVLSQAGGDRKRQRTTALQDAGATWRESLTEGDVQGSKCPSASILGEVDSIPQWPIVASPPTASIVMGFEMVIVSADVPGAWMIIAPPVGTLATPRAIVL